jgi:hypothetical protein
MTDTPENPHLTMPLDRVRADALHGVRAARDPQGAARELGVVVKPSNPPQDDAGKRRWQTICGHRKTHNNQRARGVTLAEELRFSGHTTMSKHQSNEGIIATLAALSPETLIDKEALAKIFDRHPVSIERAIRRGELPPGVRLMGKPTWTAKAILDHLNRRLQEAQKKREQFLQRISKLGA